eukprot:g27816.t1
MLSAFFQFGFIKAAWHQTSEGITAEVPQDRVFSPNIFSCFINDLPTYLKNDSSMNRLQDALEQLPKAPLTASSKPVISIIKKNACIRCKGMLPLAIAPPTHAMPTQN